VRLEEHRPVEKRPDGGDGRIKPFEMADLEDSGSLLGDRDEPIASSIEEAIGFSTSRSIPCSSKWKATAKWAEVGTQTDAASIRWLIRASCWSD
jgi:hypothetical protein